MPEGVSHDTFIETINGFHAKLDAGFKGIYDHMEKSETATALRIIACQARFGSIESRLHSADLLKQIDDTAIKEKRDTWKHIIRSLSVIGIVAAAGMVWRLMILADEVHKLGLLK